MKVFPAKLLCLFVIVGLLSGCWDRKEIDRKDYVVALGFDKAEDHQIKITFLITNPEVGSVQQGGSAQEPPVEIISVKAKDIVSPQEFANITIAREISYDMLRYIIVSEKLARDKNLIRWIYDTTKDKDIRRDNFFIVTKEDTTKFMENNKPKLETRVHKFYENMIHRGKETGLIPFSQLHTLLRITEAGADLFLGTYATTEIENDEESRGDKDNLFAGEYKPGGETNTAQFLGSAVFKGGMMIGKLTGQETRLAYLLNNIDQAPNMVAALPDPFKEDVNIGFRIMQPKNTKIKMNLEGKGSIDIKLPLIVDILTNNSMVDYAGDKAKREHLERYIEERLKEKLTELIQKTQDEYKGDPFGWSLYARKKFKNLPDYYKYNWMESYPNMDVKVNVEIRVSNYGRQNETPNIHRVR